MREFEERAGELREQADRDDPRVGAVQLPADPANQCAGRGVAYEVAVPGLVRVVRIPVVSVRPHVELAQADQKGLRGDGRLVEPQRVARRATCQWAALPSEG